MRLISSLVGDGWLKLGSAPPSQARYNIGVWSGPDDVVFGKGQISAAADTMRRAMLCHRPIDLVLCCGNLIRVIVTGSGADSAEIYVPHPHPRNAVHRRSAAHGITS